MSEELVKIDGAIGEGGGQVVRIALCLSTLYRIPVQIHSIRAGRTKGGLSAQHLKGVELLQEMCNAEVTGAFIGSVELTFKPGYLENKKQQFVADTQTAGCICLLIQIALPCALFSSRAATYILKGGTNVPFGPQIEYFKNVFRPLLNKFGADFELDVVRKGYYPKGGGEVHLRVNPVQSLKSINLLDPGSMTSIKGSAFVAGVVNMNAAQKMKNDARTTISQELNKRDITVPPMDISVYQESSNIAIGNASGINLMAKTDKDCVFGGSALGSGRPVAVPPGVEAANDLLVPVLADSCVDDHLQDQMIIFMILAKGTSRVKIGKKELTCHADTAKQIAEIMLGSRGLKFSLIKDEQGSSILECDGLGFKNEFIT